MYKVFYQNKSILVGGSNAMVEEVVDLESMPIEDVWNYCLSLQVKNISIKGANEAATWKSFMSIFKIVEAAGGLVQYEDRVLVIRRLDKWDLPKGKIEQGEAREEAALREVEEECGLKELASLGELCTTYHIYEHKGKWVLKPTYWFRMTLNTYQEPKPQIEEDITEVRWQAIHELNEIKADTYPNIELVLDYLV